jgi:hypothetical protein
VTEAIACTVPAIYYAMQVHHFGTLGESSHVHRREKGWSVARAQAKKLYYEKKKSYRTLHVQLVMKHAR